ncbi:hypothetical protein D9M69_715820 [compost metagenome]
MKGVRLVPWLICRPAGVTRPLWLSASEVNTRLVTDKRNTEPISIAISSSERRWSERWKS